MRSRYSAYRGGIVVNLKHLVIGVMMAAATVPILAQSVKNGIEAWQKADYARAVGIWRPLAEKGDADASFNLGQAYRLGRGVATNLAAAKVWYERAAAKGHVDAQTTLGLLMFENGDRAGATKWLRQAADKGEARAQLVLGTALFNGDGIKQDRLLGYAYVSRAAQQGLAPAQETLTQLDGLLPPDLRRQALALPAARTGRAVAAARVAPQAPAKRPPIAKTPILATPAAPVALPSGTGWRIQLGAFSQRSSAEALYRRLSSVFPGSHAVYVAAGAVTRLQVGPYPTRAAAAAACSAVAAKGQACFPVPGK